MNDENLLRPEDLTPSQRRANASKAGRASGAARRERKAVKQAILDALYSTAPSGLTVMEEMISGMIERVIENGDQNTFEKIMEYAGMSPERKRKEAELKLKKLEAERKNPETGSGPTIFEQMVRELYERPD